MSSDGKGGRSVVTDFGRSPSTDPAARGKKSRTRPPTTEAPAPVAPPAAASGRLPGAAVKDAHFAPGFDRSQLSERSALRGSRDLRDLPNLRDDAPTAVQVHEEGLRTKDSRLHLIREPDGAQSAAFRVLRHQLEAAGNPQVVAVSSAEIGAGKTTTAANLALALSECGRARVLLIEANFRRPTLARMFNVSPQAGFAEQLELFHTNPGTAWHVTSLPTCHLHLMPLARGRAPSPLVDGPAFRYAIEGLRSSGYDHIVVDCSSVLEGADVNLVQDATDGVILVARARKTTARQLREAAQRLTPTHIIGTTLIG